MCTFPLVILHSVRTFGPVTVRNSPAHKKKELKKLFKRIGFASLDVDPFGISISLVISPDSFVPTLDAILYHERNRQDSSWYRTIHTLRHIDDLNTDSLGCFWRDDMENYAYLFLLEGGDQNTLSHELMHATSRSLSSRGIMLDNSTEEVYAYTNGYLNEKALELWKYWKKNVRDEKSK